MHYELTSTSFFLTKGGYLWRPEKSELLRFIRKKTITLADTTKPQGDNCSIIFVDFMAYAWKLPVNKIKLKTVRDIMQNLWHKFKILGSNSHRIDIIFDLYYENSIKAHKRKRRSIDNVILAEINISEQQLPVEMHKFWPSS